MPGPPAASTSTRAALAHQSTTSPLWKWKCPRCTPTVTPAPVATNATTGTAIVYEMPQGQSSSPSTEQAPSTSTSPGRPPRRLLSAPALLQLRRHMRTAHAALNPLPSLSRSLLPFPRRTAIIHLFGSHSSGSTVSLFDACPPRPPGRTGPVLTTAPPLPSPAPRRPPRRRDTGISSAATASTSGNNPSFYRKL